MGWLTDNAARFENATHDENGQPNNPMFRAHAVQARQVDELIGLIKGVLADGAICQGEIEFLLGWMNANKGALEEWPARAIYPRIAHALSDGYMDPDEEADIMRLLMASVGRNELPRDGEASASTRLPLCDPLPNIEFAGRVFCFTGKFASGTRNWCEQQVHDRGGVGASSITRKLNFLVIGDIGSRDWLHSTHGTKIQKALEYRNSGIPLHIVSEQHWFDRLETPQ